ncbi:histidine phosphatase family protein [Colwellia sp. PAMC 21821]|uniref:histidine phosphatase family protein n=1 Tax=Colwellia sp. PAMC 21821 TaxID=1816219 RepID=UPI0009C3640D|nr:histidine phosphatase family protein [Colwellia sp. PAMC 21821]ARD45303.1 hypothetical protein A3Q33_13970 [Colwellia sp. PAMC 21821]
MSVFNVYLLRHGELVQTGILCGRTDIALSDTGKKQLVNAIQYLPNISHCYSSPLIRCREFAEKFCQKNELPIQVLAELQEMNFGDWDGKSYQSLWQPELEPDQQIELSSDKKIPTLGDFWQNPWQCQPPNGETMASFTQRVDKFWHNLLAQLEQSHLHKNKQNQAVNTLVFSHGGVIRYILAKVLGLPIPGVNHMANLDVPYGGLIHLQITIDDKGKAWPKLML